MLAMTRAHRLFRLLWNLLLQGRDWLIKQASEKRKALSVRWGYSRIRLATQRRKIIPAWWRDSRCRRRLWLGFFSVLLLAITAAVLAPVVSVIGSQSGQFSDRLAETGDWLAGGTLVLAAFAGLVALKAYASATGLPDLKISLIIEGPQIPGDDFDPERPVYTRRATGPFRFNIAIKNDSDYSARNPAVIMRLPGNYLATHSSQIGEGWAITDGTNKEIFSVQWDGGATYSIHGHSIRKIRLDVGFVILQTRDRYAKFELLAEGYRREIQIELGRQILPADWH